MATGKGCWVLGARFQSRVPPELGMAHVAGKASAVVVPCVHRPPERQGRRPLWKGLKRGRVVVFFWFRMR